MRYIMTIIIICRYEVYIDNSNNSTTTNSVDSLAFSSTPSVTPTLEVKDVIVGAAAVSADKPPPTGIKREASAERNSAGRTSANTVSKSASSTMVELLQAHPIRQSSTDPVLHSGRQSKGIFKLFRRSKEKDNKDMKTIRKLCRHSLEVNIEPIDRHKQKRSSATSINLPSTSKIREEYPSEEESSRATLPRQVDGAQNLRTTTRSCPSSPVAPHKKRASTWLSMGKVFFKGRSPSPGAKSVTK